MGDTQKVPKMLYVVIGVIKDDDQLIRGYRLFNLVTNKVLDVPSEKIQQGISNILGVRWDTTYKGLVSTCEVNISDLPVIDMKKRSLRARGGILIKELVVDDLDAKSPNIIGAVVYDTNGARGSLSYDKLSRFVGKQTGNSDAVNFDFVNNDWTGRRELKIKDMGFSPKKRVLDAYKKTSYRVTDSKEEIESTGVVAYGEDIPVMPVYSISDAISSSFNIDAGRLMQTATSNLKIMVPYYYVLLSTLKKRPCTDDVCPTMGVTEDTMFYNPAFVSSCTVGELTFILMHEVLHVAMMHAARHGKRIHKLWNIATDLYINEMLIHDFGLTPGTEKLIPVTVPGRGITKELPLTAPGWIYYFAKIGEVCNLSKDMPEFIYTRLYKENKDKIQQMKQEVSQQGGKPQQGQGQGGSGGSGDGRDEQQGDNGGSGQEGQEGGNPQGNQGQGQGQGQGQDSSDKQDGSGGSGGDKENNPFNERIPGQGGGAGGVPITYNGKQLDGECVDDVKSNVGQDTEDNKEKSREQAKQKLQDMVTKKKMVEEKSGSSLTKGMDAASLVQRMIDFNLMGTLDWRKILRNIVAGKPKKKYTLASPNEAYMNLGVTLADRRRIGRPDKIKGIVICIDVSGSVSNDLLQYFLSEVAAIYKHYDVDGMLLYWNTSVCDTGLFSKRQDLAKVNSDWSGGTDVKCVFDFLAGKKESVTHKKTEIKGKDIQAIVIVTDGYFDKNYSEYERVFGRKTLWLLDGNCAAFEPCFGKVVQLSKEEK